jgi:hypothetical protein
MRSHITTHSTGARIEWFSYILSVASVDFIRRARSIRALETAWMLRHEASSKESAGARAATKRRSNDSLNPTANSIAFRRETCFNSASRRGGLIRALGRRLYRYDYRF